MSEGSHLPPQLGRRHPALLFKDPAEVQRIIIPDQIGDLGNIVGGSLQQSPGVGHPQRKDILGRGGIGVFLEVADKPADAHAVGGGIFLNADGFIVVFMKIPHRLVHFRGQEMAFFPGLGENLTLDHDEQLIEIMNQELFIIFPTEFQLPDHHGEKALVF